MTTLDEKLDWIAAQLFIQSEFLTNEQVEEYHRIFAKPEPKQEENRRKGLFLK